MQKRTLEMNPLWQETLDIVDFADADDEIDSFEQAAENAYDEQATANDDWFKNKPVEEEHVIRAREHLKKKTLLELILLAIR